ncbi:SDR family NAD(P)-dependent oxidoreductase [Streptomyces sp. PU-14G]|uniref:SDR family NAD(P)-dependent oxidoreductase n=1 Tax=Streptomyces sp. PU-14G TaxID=2800808 RepID=UPI0034DE5882
MELGLAGKVALVTGASRGIGLAVTRALLAEGMVVYGSARNPSPELTASGARFLPADLATAEGPRRVMETVTSETEALDLLVNNAGGGDAGDFTVEGFQAETDDAWARAWELNLMSAVRTTRAALPLLLASPAGSVVNISSAGARSPGSPVSYNIAKAALTALGKALAEEFGPRGVRVNTVSPGPTRTGIWEAPGGFGERLAESLGQVPLEEFLKQVPGAVGITTGRFTEPAEVAALVAYLASPHASNIMGADLRVDGGMLKTT